MNTISRFTLNPDSKKALFISDENQFIDELELIDEVGYEFPHYYSGDEITWYRAAIIKVEKVDVNYIKNIYNITPNIIYWTKVEKHIVFYFKKSLNKFDYERISNALAYLYDWEKIDYHFYPANWVTVDFSSDDLNNDLFEICTKVYFYKWQDNEYQKLLTVSDYDNFIEADQISIEKVIKKLYDRDLLSIEGLQKWIDVKHNLHRDYWRPFEFVHKYFSSIEKAKKFFKEEFQIPFEESDALSYTNSNDWVVIREWDNIYIWNLWYYTIDWKWDNKKLTDFYIKVHAKIIWEDWKHHFIVTLVNEWEWVQTKKIVWENKTSSSTFSDFIQSYWPYHYYWTAPFIKEIHKQISTTKQVAEIQQLVWYGYHGEHNIVVFKNWVWDIKERLFTTKKDTDDDFYYNYNWKWYWITDKQSNNLSEILTDWVPSLNTDRVIDLETILDFMWELYADNSWAYLMFLSFGMIWYLLYWDQKKEFPLIFTRWITWSWKTAFNEILQKIWGIKKAWSDFENSTLFTMTVTLSYLIKFPYFIAEYREAATMRLQKVWTLRSVFDKISQTKGRADQSVVKYNYAAIPVLDWEEMIEDGALRTRSLQCQLLRKHKIKWNFNKILREWWEILDNVLFTYLTRSNWEHYQQYLDEWYEIFKPMTSENRIAFNVASIYAWCMAMNNNDEYKEKYIIVLSEIIDFQEQDVQQNSTSMQILKVMAKFMETTYTGVFVHKTEVIVSWNALEDYVNRYRVNTTLKISSYKEHLIAMWFKIDYVEAWEAFLEGVVIPFDNIPKQLLVHHEVYKWYKEWLSLKWNNNGL